MFLLSNSEVAFDFDLDLLADVLAVLDHNLEAQASESADRPDPDAFGVFDRMEHATGLAFVACQTYLTSTYAQVRVRKSEALRLGPQHRSGQTMVAVMNHAANYWKHRDEWVIDENTRREERIRAAFDQVGFPVDTDYPLSGILTELASPEPAAFRPLVPVLTRWRDELISVSCRSQD